jgi:Peptidase family M28
VGGHFDTINMTPGNTVDSPSPGANDDASGVSLTLEMARVLATGSWDQTLVFVAFSGEEQGLFGSTALAKAAKAEAWKIDAVLSNDMVGNPVNLRKERDDRHVRVFSEESEVHQGRELARWIEWTQRQSGSRFGVKLVFRRDRFGRGGDHTPFNREGFTAVRFVEVHEEYSRQHTPNDLPEFVDERYLANVAKVNLRAMANLAMAGAQPRRVRVDAKQGYETHLTWAGDENADYVVYWRETTSPVWQHARTVHGLAATIAEAHKDDHVFAVGAPGGIPVEAK